MNEAFKQETLSTIGKENGNKGISYQALEKMMSESKNLSENDRVDYKKLFKELLHALDKEGVVKKVSNPKNKGSKKTLYKVVNKPKPTNRPPIGIGTITSDINDTGYKGRGGEYAVMSELLFNGFDANLMTVDKGQDIIARKDSTWYFIQVKTTSLDSNKKACWKIPKHTVNRFYAEGTMKYVLVARCSAVGKPQNRIFCFSNDEINTFTTQGYISQGRDDITITIQYSQDNVPYLCSGNAQTDVSKWGNLDSIIGRRL